MMRPGRSWSARVLAVVLMAAVLSSGCGALDDGAAAMWDLGAGQTIDAGTTTFVVTVTRVECNNGVTGTVNAPDVTTSDDDVVITFTVSPVQDGPAACPGNDGVAYEVRLPEAIGDRALVDGGCVSTGAGDAAACTRAAARRAP